MSSRRASRLSPMPNRSVTAGKIGRGSGRGRGEISGGAVSFKKKKKNTARGRHGPRLILRRGRSNRGGIEARLKQKPSLGVVVTSRLYKPVSKPGRAIPSATRAH